MDETRKGEIIDFIARAAAKGRKPAPQLASSPVRIEGNHNIVGNNNQVNFVVEKTTKRTVVQPGPGAITEAQAAELKELVDRIVDKKGVRHQQIWATFNRKFRLASYRMLPAREFDTAHAYLRAWVGRAVPSRAKLLARIHAQAAKYPGSLERLKIWADLSYGTGSLSELTNDQLLEMIRYAGF